MMTIEYNHDLQLQAIKEKGVEEGLDKGIRSSVKMLRSVGASDTVIITKLMEEFNLTREEAQLTCRTHITHQQKATFNRVVFFFQGLDGGILQQHTCDWGGGYEFESESILFTCLDLNKRPYLASAQRYSISKSGSLLSVLIGLVHDYTNQSRIVIHNKARKEW